MRWCLTPARLLLLGSLVDHRRLGRSLGLVAALLRHRVLLPCGRAIRPRPSRAPRSRARPARAGTPDGGRGVVAAPWRTCNTEAAHDELAAAPAPRRGHV